MKPTLAALSWLLVTLSACATPAGAQETLGEPGASPTRYVSDEVKVMAASRDSATLAARLLTYELVIQTDHSVLLDESELIDVIHLLCPEGTSDTAQGLDCVLRDDEGPPQRRRHTRYEGRAIFNGDALTRLELSPLKGDKYGTTGFVMPCKQAPEGRFICARPLPTRGKVDVNFRLVPRA